MQPVARLARTAVTNIVRNDDEVLVHIEQLPLTKQDTGETPPYELGVTTTRAVVYDHRVCHPSVLVFQRRTESYIVQLEFRERFAVLKLEIFYDKIARHRRRQRRGGLTQRQ